MKRFFLLLFSVTTVYAAIWGYVLLALLFQHMSLFGNSSPFTPAQMALMLALTAGFIGIYVFAWVFCRKKYTLSNGKTLGLLLLNAVLSLVAGTALMMLLLRIIASIRMPKK